VGGEGRGPLYGHWGPAYAPVESILAKAVEDVAIVGRLLCNAWKVGPHPRKPVADGAGAGPVASVAAVIR
jgi:hypothetical protein